MNKSFHAVIPFPGYIQVDCVRLHLKHPASFVFSGLRTFSDHTNPLGLRSPLMLQFAAWLCCISLKLK